MAIENLNNEENGVAQEQRLPRQIFACYDPFQASEFQFMKNFRLTKNLTRELCVILRPYMIENTRASALTVEKKVRIILIHLLWYILYYSNINIHKCF